MVDVLFYAPGAGRGHTTRAAAILRRIEGEALVVTTGGSTQPLDAHGIRWQEVSYDDAVDTMAAVGARVTVVDANPVGYARELEGRVDELPGARVLIWRGRLAVPSAPRAAERFDRVLLADRDHEVVGVDCTPILIRDADELLEREEARARLCAGAQPVILLVEPVSGGERLAGLVEAAGIATVATDHYPAVELFNGVDGLIGTPGYNLHSEARACGVPAAWVWRDGTHDQPLRVRSPVREASELVAWARSVRSRDGAHANYVNGARTAAWQIARLARRSSW